jgi:hypothetical protein
VAAGSGSRGPGHKVRCPGSSEEGFVKKLLMLVVLVALGALVAKKVRAA